MAQGRVKDPQGHQAFPILGYIQRTDSYTQDPPHPDLNKTIENPELLEKLSKGRSLNWLDDGTPKVIPFCNCCKMSNNTSRKFKFNELVEFQVDYATVTFRDGTKRFIGVAVDVKPIIEDRENCD